MKPYGGRLPEHFGWMAASVGFCVAFEWALHFVTERPFLPREPKLTIPAAAGQAPEPR